MTSSRYRQGVNSDGIGYLRILPSDNSRLGRCHICQTNRSWKENTLFRIGRLKDASLVCCQACKIANFSWAPRFKENARKADKECVLGWHPTKLLTSSKAPGKEKENERKWNGTVYAIHLVGGKSSEECEEAGKSCQLHVIESGNQMFPGNIKSRLWWSTWRPVNVCRLCGHFATTVVPVN